jgi:hypothetical protein
MLTIIGEGIWDLVMDWSLLDPYSHPRLLRDHLAFKSVWPYYVAMILDPILRFNWVFYAIYGTDNQHSAILSFFIAFSEICRRGVWTIFRVENEHCTNVGRFRASRDVPLPYKIKKSAAQGEETAEAGEDGPRDEAYVDDDTDEDEEAAAKEAERRRQGVSISPSLSRTRSYSTGVDMMTRQRTPDDVATVRQRAQRRQTFSQASPVLRGLSYVGSLLHTAHAQDFERKRKDDEVTDVARDKGDAESDTDLDEDEDEEDEEVEAEVEARIEAEIGAWGGVGSGEESSSGSAGEEDGPSSKKKKGKKEKEFSFHPKRQPSDGDLEASQHSAIDEDEDGALSPRASSPAPGRRLSDESVEHALGGKRATSK